MDILIALGQDVEITVGRVAKNRVRGSNPSTSLRKGCTLRYAIDRNCGIRVEFSGSSGWRVLTMSKVTPSILLDPCPQCNCQTQV